jgi:hypothetical protein
VACDGDDEGCRARGTAIFVGRIEDGGSEGGGSEGGGSEGGGANGTASESGVGAGSSGNAKVDGAAGNDAAPRLLGVRPERRTIAGDVRIGGAPATVGRRLAAMAAASGCAASIRTRAPSDSSSPASSSAVS